MSATITAAEVNKLRQETGAGLMDCKKALQETGGDFEAAIDFLRKKGQKVSAKRADREANEGVVLAETNADQTTGYALHLTAETDFVAKNEEFIQFAKDVMAIAKKHDLDTADQLLSASMDDVTVQDKLNEMVAKIGEKIGIGGFEKLEGDTVVPYIHANYKIGVLVALNKPANDKVLEIGKDIAMQVAAMKPLGIDENDVPEEVKQKEMALGKEQALAEGKPEHIVEKIAEGKLRKFYKENTLLSQQFVKDTSKTVGEVLKEVDKELTVSRFKRLAVG